MPKEAVEIKTETGPGERVHPHIEDAAKRIGSITAAAINSWPRGTSHPYEKQAILEELIRLLQEAV